MLDDFQRQDLETFFTIEEIKTTLFNCNASKAPGPGGLSFAFYQACWDFVKSDLYKLFACFYFHDLDISKLNLAYVCLIPKKEITPSISNYKPISLINCSFKLITKLLADRLAKVMDFLIDDTQTTFIKGRNIMDNVVVATEVLHHFRVSN